MAIKYNDIKAYLKEKWEFRYNEVANEYEVKTRKKDAEWEVISLDDLADELFTQGWTGFDKMLGPMLRKRDIVPHYDPFNHYFDNLPVWDGETDYIAELCKYVHTKDNQFWLTMMKKALVRMYAQSVGKITFNKQCLTLLGTQNDGKSHFLRFLCPKPLERYFLDNPPLESKESVRCLAERFILNIDDMSNMPKADLSKIKSLFAEQNIKVRLPYARDWVTLQRRASFVASTNEADFLVDHTGNVRWVVIEVLGIKHDNGGPNGYTAVDIDRVWSQAVGLFKQGYAMNLNKDEMEHSERNNENYTKDSVEYELLAGHFEPCTEEMGGYFYQPKDIVRELFILYGSAFKLNTVQIGKALQKMKVQREQTRRPGCTFPVKGYWLRFTNNLPERNALLATTQKIPAF